MSIDEGQHLVVDEATSPFADRFAVDDKAALPDFAWNRIKERFGSQFVFQLAAKQPLQNLLRHEHTGPTALPNAVGPCPACGGDIMKFDAMASVKGQVPQWISLCKNCTANFSKPSWELESGDSFCTIFI
ncbi:hypothetical protein [Rhodopirellula islandica]|uniref:hypothetical protein n=1 Tax=Rhodopirellula islandica TaxID=595434 RepID=UPI000649C985|nr:hypothetical protein [Rhodopirellula islandica]